MTPRCLFEMTILLFSKTNFLPWRPCSSVPFPQGSNKEALLHLFCNIHFRPAYKSPRAYLPPPALPPPVALMALHICAMLCFFLDSLNAVLRGPGSEK